MRPSYIVVALALSLPANARAQDTELQALRDSIARIESRLFSATNLHCEYGEGTFASYEGSFLGPAAGPALERDDTLTPARFTNIDLDRRTANLYDTQVAVFRSGPLLNFLETTPLGSLVLTTVFAATFNSGAYVAVTSRHIGNVAGAPPMPSQYHGSCTPF